MLRKNYLLILLSLILTVLVIEPASPQEDQYHFPPQAILIASYLGDEDLVRDILSTDIDKNVRDNFGDTALHVAIYQKNVSVIKMLLDYGFDPNAVAAGNGNTPLHNAVAANNAAAARLLIQYGANKNIKAKDGFTPIDKARKEDKREMLLLLSR
jgi:ankyrin repeat protein